MPSSGSFVTVRSSHPVVLILLSQLQKCRFGPRRRAWKKNPRDGYARKQEAVLKRKKKETACRSIVACHHMPVGREPLRREGRSVPRDRRYIQIPFAVGRRVCCGHEEARGCASLIQWCWIKTRVSLRFSMVASSCYPALIFHQILCMFNGL